MLLFDLLLWVFTEIQMTLVSNELDGIPLTVPVYTRVHCVHIHGRTVTQFRFLLGKSLQNILPFFHMVFSLGVQTFLLKIQEVNDGMENASFFRE